MGNHYMNIIKKINYWLFYVAVCMLPFPTRISLYAWVGWLCSWLLEFRFLKRDNVSWHRGLLPIILLAVLFVWEMVSGLWAINQQDAFDMVIRHLSYVGILPLAIWGVNELYDWTKVAKCFVISCCASIFLYGLYVHVLDFIPYIRLHHTLPDFVYSWSFFGDRISLFKHRLYYGTVLNLAIVVLLQIRVPLLVESHRRKLISTIFFVGLIVLVLGVIWTGSRANMLTLLIVSAVAVVQPLRGYTRFMVASMVCAVGLVICALLFTLHPRFQMLEMEHITQRDTYQVYEIEPRINIWYSALQTPEDYFWQGVGVGANTEYLKPVFASLHWDRFYERQYNAHNQYLGTLINLGVFGMIFFLLIWLLYPMWYKGRIQQFATLVVLILGLNMLTENVLDRIDGVMITCASMLVISLLSRVQHAK